MIFSLMFFSPLLLLIAAGLAGILLFSGREGVSFFVWLVFFSSGSFGLLATIMTVKLVAIGGERAQRSLLGGRYAGPFALRGYEESDFPDPGQQWRYRLDRLAQALPAGRHGGPVPFSHRQSSR
jgi:hypothetical protein